MSDESLLDLTGMQEEIEEAEELKVAEAGEEYKLRIASVRTGEDKNGKDYFVPIFEIPNDPMVSEFSDFFHVPEKDKMTEKEYKRTLAKIKLFTKAFEIDISRPLGFSDDLPGHEGWAILGVREDDQYGEQNTIRKYIAPK